MTPPAFLVRRVAAAEAATSAREATCQRTCCGGCPATGSPSITATADDADPNETPAEVEPADFDESEPVVESRRYRCRGGEHALQGLSEAFVSGARAAVLPQPPHYLYSLRVDDESFVGVAESIDPPVP